MSKLLLLSLMVAMVVIPVRAARDPDPRQGLRRAILSMVAFETFYTFGLVYLWGRW